MFATIVLPLMRPYLVAAAALAFVSGVGNFGIAALLGLPVNYLTLPTLIYRQMSSFGPGVLPQMASLSVLIAPPGAGWRGGPGARHGRCHALFRRHSCALAARPLALAAGRASRGASSSCC